MRATEIAPRDYAEPDQSRPVERGIPRRVLTTARMDRVDHADEATIGYGPQAAALAAGRTAGVGRAVVDANRLRFDDELLA